MNKTLLVLLASVLVVPCFAPVASAHASKTIGDGSIKITWGFLDEPAFVGVKNKLDLIIRDNATNAGIGGLTAANFTEVKLRVGEDEYDLGNVSAYRGAKGASAGDGNYTAANQVYPTKRGVYSLHIAGTINGQAFEAEIPATHEMEPIEEIAFPAEAEDADDAALEARIAALETKVAALEAKAKTQSETPATVTTQTPTPGPIPGLGLALLAIGAVVVALGLRRRA